MRNRANILFNIDWAIVITFSVLVLFGWLNIYGADFNEDYPSIFDTSQRYGKQAMWIGGTILIAFIIMLLESKVFSYSSYIIYGVNMLLLVVVLAVAKDVNGARSWIEIGPFKIQPSEFAKFATSLAIAKYLSDLKITQSRNTSFSEIGVFLAKLFTGKIVFRALKLDWKTQIMPFVFIAIPMIFILLQDDTGSALVYLAFIFVWYREGFSGSYLLIVFFMMLIAIMSLMIEKDVVIIGLATLAFLVYIVFLKKTQNAIYALGGLVFYFILKFTFGWSEVSTVYIIFGAIGIGLLYNFIAEKVWKKFEKNFVIIALLLGIGFIQSVDFIFESVLQKHQKQRVDLLLGKIEDVRELRTGIGYQVYNAKVSIGSGGVTGKGFLNGPMTIGNHVPEQSTDYIFCTVGEEWGFIVSAITVALFLFLIVRIILVAERQRSTFSRIYGYCVASILFIHLLINIGMVIGLAPVIGIPLPFMSYGGSSLWGFTVLLFLFVKFDSERLEIL